MALGAAEVAKVGLSFFGKDGVDLEGLHDGEGLVGGGEERGRNGLAGEAGAFHLEVEKGVSSGVEVGELDGVPSGFEGGGALEFFDPASIAGSFGEDFFSVEEKGAAVHLEVEGVVAGLLDLEKSIEADGGVMRDICVSSFEGGEGEVVDLTGLVGLDVTGEAFPDFTTPSGVGEVAGDAGLLEKVVGDAVEILARKPEVGHASGGADGVRALQEFAETLVGVFLGEVAEGNGGAAEVLCAFGIAWRVAGDAAHGVEKLVSLFGGNGIGCLLLEVRAFVEGDEVVGDFLGDRLLFVLVEMVGKAGHGGAEFDRVGRGDEGLQVVGIHAGADGREAG